MPEPAAARPTAPQVAELHRGGHGTPLLLLHGASITWRTWKPVLPLLEPHHHVIAPTLVGHTGGPPLEPGMSISMDSLVDGVIACLDEAGIARPVHVVGNSLGGWIALELARRGHALSVTAFSPGGAWRSPLRYAATAAAMKVGVRIFTLLGERADRIATSPRARRLFGRLACEHPERLDAEEFLADLRAVRATPVLHNLMRALEPASISPMPDPGFPIRIVWARRDLVTPFRHYGRPLLDRLPTAELVVLDGVGHVPMIDDPRAVANQILQVTTGVDGSRSPNASCRSHGRCPPTPPTCFNS